MPPADKKRLRELEPDEQKVVEQVREMGAEGSMAFDVVTLVGDNVEQAVACTHKS